MNSGSTPGDGKTSPFGNGQGGLAGGNMAGNDFGTNPRGNPSGTSRPADMINNSRTQTSATKSDINPQDAAPGGLIPDALPPANRAGGVGSIGNNAKPFRLGGG